MPVSAIVRWKHNTPRRGQLMDSKIRLLTKAVTWQVAGFFTMMLISFLFTGSVTASGAIAIAGSITGFVSYFAHELAWSKIAWGVLSGK
jgi:uncharacterized membrane protein